MRGIQPGEPAMNGHAVQFYERESYLLDSVTEYIGSALRAASAGILIATPPHRDGVAQRLTARGLDVTGAAALGRYVAIDARDTLDRFMVGGWPDPARFDDAIGALIAKTRERAPKVFAFGEMVALLGGEGNRGAAIGLEELWNELATRQPFSLLCAYPIEAFRDTSHAKPFRDMSAAHTHVIPAESYMQLKGDAQLRIIAQLQQQAAALEAETIQRRYAEAELRKKVEQLADADRRKDEFLAMLGHELRNPLAPVTTALQLMRLHRDEPQRVARARETIERQVEHMTRLIDDLLDVSRITRGKIELRQEGIGLSLVRRLVEMHGGTVEARSDGPGQGSEFIARVPMRPVPHVAPNVDPIGAGVAALPKRRILVVDDNVDAADALAELLRDYGHDVRAAHDGQGAIEQAALHPPDIVLLDIGMPGFDGYEVARRMRGELGLKATLVAVARYRAARPPRPFPDAPVGQDRTEPGDIPQLDKPLNPTHRTAA